MKMLIAVPLAFCSLVFAQHQNAEMKHQDSGGLTHLQKEVRHELVMLPNINVFDNLEFSVNGSTVTLTGQVTNPAVKNDAGNVVKHIEGVTEVNNQIQVLPLSPNDGRLQGSGLYPATKQALIPIVIQGQNEVGDRRNGHYVGVSIAWTRSALMSQLDAGVAGAKAAGLKVFETRDTADVCTLCGTPGGFGRINAKDMGKVFAGGH